MRRKGDHEDKAHKEEEHEEEEHRGSSPHCTHVDHAAYHGVPVAHLSVGEVGHLHGPGHGSSLVIDAWTKERDERPRSCISPTGTSVEVVQDRE